MTVTTAELPRSVAGDDAGAAAAPTRRGGARRTDWLWGAGAALIALVVAAIDLELWRADLSVPFRLGGDADFYLMVTDGLLKHGWHLVNPELGAPGSQALYDLPHGADNLQFLLIKLIGTLTGNSAARAVNLYYLATFPLAAGIAFGVLRALKVTREPALVFAVLYALLPYHFERGTTHLLLSGYYMVPVGVLLVLSAVGDDPPFTQDGSWRPRLSKRSILPLLGCAAIASTGAYYAVFTLVLLVGVALADFAIRRRARTLTAAGVTAGAIVLVLALNLAPTLAYWIANGANADVARRTPQETELYGLRISELVVPRADHRIGPLGSIEREIRQFKEPSEGGMPLGAVGAIGFLGLVGAAVAFVAGNHHPRDRTLSATGRRLATANLVAVLVATIGGFSIILSALSLRDIRAWNRISVVIGFLALAAVAIVWDRVARPRLGAVLAAVLVGAIGVVGVLDQTSSADAPDYSATQKTWASDARFTEALDRALPAGAEVFQVPYIAFPETAPVAAAGAYDDTRLSLHTDDIRWSYGAMTGRDVTWQPAVAAEDAPQMVQDLRRRGFDGIVVDRAAFTDADAAAARVGRLAATAGAPAVTSPDGRWVFIRLP